MNPFDPLTGLYNRDGFQKILSREIRWSRRSGTTLLAMLINLDNFKDVNNNLGYAVGDIVLKEINFRIRSSFRDTDYVARIGGDNFMVLLPETRMAEGIRIAERARLAISGTPVSIVSGKDVKMTASIGIVDVTEQTPSVDEVLERLYPLLNRGKSSGKDKVVYIKGRDDYADIVDALRQGRDLYAVKQPIYDLADMRKIGYEFFTRSTIKDFEKPDDFFHISLEANMLTLVDHRCFRICIDAAKSLTPDMQCHINIFPSTIIDIPVAHLLEEIPARRKDRTYCIEISEQQIIGDPSYLIEPVKRFKKAGILVAIDDVGFGRSCLESLILLEPDIAKIDRRYVNGIARDMSLQHPLDRILKVIRNLDAEAIAEGIESKEDLEVLRQLGVRYGQGFLLDRK